MKLNELLKGLPIVSYRGDLSVEITNITYDSRKVREGSLFVCIDGFNRDGHTYIPMAVNQGAAAILVQNSVNGLPIGDSTVVRVFDSRYALAVVSAAFFGQPSHSIDLVALTGAAGKRTLGYLLHHYLTRRSVPCGFLNGMRIYNGARIFAGTRNHPGPPEIQGALKGWLETDVQVGLLPISQQDVQFDRVSETHFEIGLILNSKNALSDREVEFYDRCSHLILNQDDMSSHLIKAKVRQPRLITFGITHEADIKAEEVHIVHIDGKAGTEFKIVSKYFPTLDIFLPLPGRFNVYNTLALIACLWQLGFAPAEVVEELPYLMAQGRVQPVDNDLGLQIYIDVAWQPHQLEALLMALRPYCRRRLIAVLGAAGNRSRSNRIALGKICGELADQTILTATSSRGESPTTITEDLAMGIKRTACAYEIHHDRTSGIEKAISLAAPGDMVLLLGKGEQTFEVSSQETKSVSDLIVARQVLNRLEKQQIKPGKKMPDRGTETTADCAGGSVVNSAAFEEQTEMVKVEDAADLAKDFPPNSETSRKSENTVEKRTVGEVQLEPQSDTSQIAIEAAAEDCARRQRKQRFLKNQMVDVAQEVKR
ncbi:MAG TPA: UDP-N-acetylmuramyl-tripeptide synthetase [Clostridiaceae bacterium]|nr:UDP-N-acetylmuramyl-tripeptide synthetase [Clostridiaceae bacterium]